MCPWVVIGLIRLRRASSSITCFGSPLDAVAMDWSVSAPARARIASSAVGYPSSTMGPPLTTARRPSARAICLIPSSEIFPFNDCNVCGRGNLFGVDGNAVWNAREICCHLSNHRLKTLIEHLLQIIILPPRLGHVMIGEDLSAGRGEKPSTKNIQVYFRTAPGKTQEWVVVFVDGWLATARHSGVVQSQSRSVFAEGKHNMDEADTRLIRLDDRLRNLALGLKLLKAAVYSGKLTLQSGNVFWLAGCNLRSQVFALLLKLKLL